jgi:hypothetical protein
VSRVAYLQRSDVCPELQQISAFRKGEKEEASVKAGTVIAQLRTFRLTEITIPVLVCRFVVTTYRWSMITDSPNQGSHSDVSEEFYRG